MQLINTKKLPQEVIPVLESHTKILFEVLGQELVGVYVHGSLAMGGFNPDGSDIDYLAVVSKGLTDDERRNLAGAFLEIYGKDIPAKAIEMSIVEERFVGQEYRYPTPYEFHMGTKEQVKLHGKPHEKEYLDPDLAAHFTHTKKRGLCIYGKPIDEVFAEVPKEDHLASIALDSEESYKNIQEKTKGEQCIVPKYAVLNFCRVLAFIEEGLISSKIEGAEWGLKELPEKYRPVIAEALEEYRNVGASKPIDSELLKEFASYARDKISIATK